MDFNAASLPMSAPIYEATVRPHRSLSRKGVFIVIGCMLTASLAVTSLMALLGAWPVVGFNGADITLAIFLLWLNIRAARAVEVISLNASTLNIRRTDINGRHETLSLAPYWLNIVLQERTGTVPKLLLASRGQQTEIARQLGDAEKRDLAASLTRALNKWRTPASTTRNSRIRRSDTARHAPTPAYRPAAHGFCRYIPQPSG